MKLAIIGNSHAACLILALREKPDLMGKHIKPTVFASIGNHLSYLQTMGRSLVPSTRIAQSHFERSSEGIGSIDIDLYDAFFLVGMDYRINRVSRQYSRAVIDRSFDTPVYQGYFWRNVDSIRAMSEKPVICAHVPLEATEPVPGVFLSYEESLAEVQRRVEDKQVDLFRQPQETRNEDIFTKLVYSQGSVRLSGALSNSDIQHGASDRFHMNSAYGAAVLKQLAASI